MGRIEKSVLIFLMIIASVLPPVAYDIFSNAPTVCSQQAKDLPLKEPISTLLIDVQEKQEFDRIHLNGSVNIPCLDGILGRIYTK